MSRPFLVAVVICVASLLSVLPANAQAWQSRLAGELPLMGHRNWILVVDSAYPQQVGPGIETIETNADQLEVVRTVLAAVQKSIHVRPIIFTDTELAFIHDKEAPGISDYRTQLNGLLHGYDVHSRLHQSLIDELARDGALYHVLILKTQLAIPYTSVFLHLDCKYWGAESERSLREAMSSHGEP